MNVPLKAIVKCSDGLCGRIKKFLINPVNKRIT